MTIVRRQTAFPAQDNIDFPAHQTFDPLHQRIIGSTTSPARLSLEAPDLSHNGPSPLSSLASSQTVVGDARDPFISPEIKTEKDLACQKLPTGHEELCPARPAIVRGGIKDLEKGNIMPENKGLNESREDKANNKRNLAYRMFGHKSFSPHANGGRDISSNKTTRFQQEDSPPWSLQIAWSSIRARLRNPSHPSSSSQLESALGETDTTSAIGSFVRPKGHRSGTGGGHSSVGRGYSASQAEQDDDDPIGLTGAETGRIWEPVSVVAVENDLGRFVPPAKSDNGSAANTGDGRTSHARGTSVTNRNTAQSRDTEGSTTQPSWVARMARDGSFGKMKSKNGEDDGSSIRRERRANPIKRTWLYEMVAERMWPVAAHFCDSKFPEASKEKSYLKEVHFTLRRGALCASLFYVISWILTAALQSRPIDLYGWVGYILATGLFIVPLPLAIIYEMVKKRPFLYQAWLWCATWGFSIIVIVDMYRCGFYSDHRNCGKKDFLGLFYWSLALPVLSILALGGKRAWHIFGVVVWVALCIALIFVGGSPGLMYRNFANFILFHGFLLMVSYLKEKSDRQLFSLRTQLKLQYRATQQAQISEKKANALSRRFVSYIFHEVRVPLNTALLAVQNLESEGVYETVDKDQRDMVDGLQASLTMMEKVLNDVLSFNRMESGKFTTSRKPLDLHKSVQLVVLSHNAQALAGGLYLKAELDPEIDKLGGIFISDEMRIRQVMSNLVSNATKFTSSGGITVTTKLLWPRLAQFAPLPDQEHTKNGLEVNNAPDGDVDPNSGPFAPYQKGFLRGLHDKAIIRVEVKDTGIGLSDKDTRRGALFSPYVQTEIGRRQGGKGTGLGLALCMQIVKTLGGRMGVDSQIGCGSTFWFELALLLPPPAADPSSPSQPFEHHHVPPAVHVSDKAYSGDVDSKLETATVSEPSGPLNRSESNLPVGGQSSGHLDHPTASSASPFQLPYEILPYQRHLKAENVFDVIEEQVHTEVMHQQYPGIAATEDVQYQESETSTVFRKDSDVPFSFRKTSDASHVNSKTLGRININPKDGQPALRCLVVDDDNMTRKLMCRMLQRLGHQTDQAENGKLAFEMVRDSISKANPYDIVFLDNQMPLWTGVQCVRELREIGCPVYVCGATGNALQDDQCEYLDAGADRILTKPIKQASMIEAIDEARLRIAGQSKPKWSRKEQLSDEILGESTPPPMGP